MAEGRFPKPPLHRRVNCGTFFLDNGLDSIVHLIQAPFQGHREKWRDLFDQHCIDRAQVPGVGTHDFKGANCFTLVKERRNQHRSGPHV